jgi:hypothetical protein
MVYVEAPHVTGKSTQISIFLAGGIQNCPDHQTQLMDLIKTLDITVYNPRRKNFPIKNPSAAQEQITWEFDHLRKATIISFWFCKETLQPIVLF